MNGDTMQTSEKHDLRPRSMQQHRLYWACIVPAYLAHLMREGYSVSRPEDAHEILKHELLGGRSTTTLSVTEFKNYIDRILWLFDGLGIKVDL